LWVKGDEPCAESEVFAGPTLNRQDLNDIIGRSNYLYTEASSVLYHLPYLSNLRILMRARIDPTAMAVNYQDHIILFGDSLTQRSWDIDQGGIGARLAGTWTPMWVTTATFHRLRNAPDLYARKLDILNRGFSGYNTDWALPVWEQVRQRDISSSRVVV
jgi:hypothetical protein